jgi:hypothetical protein
LSEGLAAKVAALEQIVSQQAKALAALQSITSSKKEKIDKIIELANEKGSLDVLQVAKALHISRQYANDLIKQAGTEKGLFFAKGSPGQRISMVFAANEKNRVARIAEEIHADFERRNLQTASTAGIVSAYGLSNGDCEAVVNLLLRRSCYAIDRPKFMMNGKPADFSHPDVCLRRIEE